MPGGPQLTASDVAEHYDERYYADLAERYRRKTRFARQRIHNVFSLLPQLAGLRVLDLGCGMGTFTLEAARRDGSAVGVDPTPQALAAARRIAADGANVTSHQDHPEPGFVLADAAQLPVATGTFDVAIAADLTEHLDDDTLNRTLAEAGRALGPGGILLIYTPSPSHLFERLRSTRLLRPDPSHIGMRSGETLADAVSLAGFEVQRLAYLPSHLPVWNVLERRLGSRIPLLRRRIGLLARKRKAT